MLIRMLVESISLILLLLCGCDGSLSSDDPRVELFISNHKFFREFLTAVNILSYNNEFPVAFTPLELPKNKVQVSVQNTGMAIQSKQINILTVRLIDVAIMLEKKRSAFPR